MRKLMLGLLLVLLVAGCGGSRNAPKPAGQAKAGPGGADYAHASMRQTTVGGGGDKAWIFEPADPAPEQAPVIVLLHGWGNWGPVVYKQWITHLVRRGNIVIHPKYQTNHLTLPIHMTANAVKGVRAALAELKKDGHVHFDGEHFAVAGHSLGGVIAANLAATAEETGLPQPLAVMCALPGDPKLARFSQQLNRTINVELASIMVDYAAIPQGTLLLVIVGDRDKVVGDATAKVLWQRVQHLPAADRDYVAFQSDDHGRPKLKAIHVTPAAPTAGSLMDYTKSTTNAFDYYGTWKLLDGLTDAAFYGRNRAYALGNTPEQRYMGTWSDGTPVKELFVLDKE